jgi:hypothetical protein
MIRHFAIVFGIGMLLPVLIHYGVEAYQPLPRFEKTLVASVRLTPTTPEGWKAWDEEERTAQEAQRKKLAEIDEATRPFYRDLILAATPLGIAAILIGWFLRFPAAGHGLMLGGFISIAIGYSGYWAHLDDWVRYPSLLVAFCLACSVGYREFMVKPNKPA